MGLIFNLHERIATPVGILADSRGTETSIVDIVPLERNNINFHLITVDPVLQFLQLVK
jgi:hypothetical protein